MNASSFPYLSLGILALLVGGLVGSSARILRSQAIAIVVTTTLLVGLGFWTAVGAGNPWQPDSLWRRLGIDSGTGWMMLVLCLMDLLIVLVAPEQDLKRGIVGGALILSAGNLIAYAAHDLTTMWSGWILGAMPFLFGALRRNQAVRSALVPAVGSVLVFGMALAAQAAGARPLTVSTLILVAIALRKGILPFHGWVVRAFAESPLVWIMLLFNGHLGGLLLLRHEIARHGLEQGIVEIASGIVILSSIVCSLRALVEANPRRLLGYLFIGQSGLVVGGGAPRQHRGDHGSPGPLAGRGDRLLGSFCAAPDPGKPDRGSRMVASAAGPRGFRPTAGDVLPALLPDPRRAAGNAGILFPGAPLHRGGGAFDPAGVDTGADLGAERHQRVPPLHPPLPGGPGNPLPAPPGSPAKGTLAPRGQPGPAHRHRTLPRTSDAAPGGPGA